jgi:hypothetical protein
MSALASNTRARLALAACAGAWAGLAVAQAPTPVKPAPAPAGAPAFAAPEKSADGRYGLQMLVPKVSVHSEPSSRSPVIAELQQGARVFADRRTGAWYRIRLSDGREGWVGYVVGRTSPNFSVDATPGIERGVPLAGGVAPSPGAATPAAPEAAVAAAPAAIPEDRVVQQRPMGRPLEPIIPEIDPRQVPPPSPLLPHETVPIPDRWRLTDQLKLVNQRWYDPYNPNTLKGDRPLWGEDWFFAFTGISDTLMEWRQLPTGSGAQSSERPQTNDTFGRGKQSTFVQTLIASLSILKGDTTFKPPEIEFRFVPAYQYNYTRTEEVRVVNIDPTKGTTRRDSFLGVQELWVDYEWRINSPRYDFDDVRVGIQPFISDFRGFLFQDQPIGIRFFGNHDNNQWQYNVAAFQRIDKDTNSGLNDLGKPLRKDWVFVANLYRQDFMVPGFTVQGTAIFNLNRETADEFVDDNGFQVRPAVFGTSRPHGYKVGYLGASVDGHLGRWNTTGSVYWAIGRDDANMYTGESSTINALFAAAELSRDFDWIRVRGSALVASGDKDPYDDTETGFDAILENPQFAGADTSFWIRQGIPLIGGGGVALSGRNAVLPSLRSSKDQGQSNFINPGLVLLGIGADFDLTPRWRVTGNLNQLWFVNTAPLSVQRNQGEIDRTFGTDISVAVQYRPLFSQNIVFNTSAGILAPGKGFKQLYEGSPTPYSILANLVLTF